MRFLEYMGFVLAVFPLKYGFIIVQAAIHSFLLGGSGGMLPKENFGQPDVLQQ